MDDPIHLDEVVLSLTGQLVDEGTLEVGMNSLLNYGILFSTMAEQTRETVSQSIVPSPYITPEQSCAAILKLNRCDRCQLGV